MPEAKLFETQRYVMPCLMLSPTSQHSARSSTSKASPSSASPSASASTKARRRATTRTARAAPASGAKPTATATAFLTPAAAPCTAPCCRRRGLARLERWQSLAHLPLLEPRVRVRSQEALCSVSPKFESIKMKTQNGTHLSDVSRQIDDSTASSADSDVTHASDLLLGEEAAQGAFDVARREDLSVALK